MVLRQLSRQASVKVGKTWTGTKRRAQRIFIFILELLLDFCRGEDSVDGKKKKDSLTDKTETVTEKKES
ncbi:agnoprotein [Yellow baboon polyomavirus 2]|uniref:Agnoprotein n=2 Tax=Polyomaviridae TaxID=151341 RepID=AGNO_POVS1|nr:agnoprotein [Yellow baboon polyomavirus 2]YP_406551.1 agnoprotein [Simian virus 12]Q3L6L9.1 RecName: Full=Agnoprotein; AltName: Full=Agno [Simian virus 12 strain wt100]AAV75981.1 agnoprotein [Simian virus 12]ABD92873.1 agnoprotein [Simian virus 12]BAM71849.1 agnoprotein [Yellow baboon polyomavirus 2]